MGNFIVRVFFLVFFGRSVGVFFRGRFESFGALGVGFGEMKKRVIGERKFAVRIDLLESGSVEGILSNLCLK